MRTRRSVLALAAIVAGLLLAPAAEAASPAPTLGPKPARCGVGCWGATHDVLSVSWLADFTVDPVIGRKGKIFTAKVTPLNHLGHLKGWTWPWPNCAPNTPVCKFRAKTSARRWFRIGMNWNNDVGSAVTENVWAVLGKDEEMIWGYVRDEAGDGVGGIRVNLKRKKSTATRYVVTGGDGFYNAIVKAGTYTVKPVARRGKKTPDRFEPSSKVVTVKEGKVARGDFKLLKTLKVTIAGAPRVVAATGSGVVELTVKAERDDAPVANQLIDVWPMRSTPAEQLAVPGVLCAPFRVWPNAEPGQVGASTPRGVRTDANGLAKLTLYVGTAPGTITIQAWAENASGALRGKNTEDVRDEVAITVQPRPGNRVGSLSGLKGALQTYLKAQAIDLPTSEPNLLAKTLNDMAGAGGFADVVFSPIRKSTDGEIAILATLAGAHPVFGAGGKFTAPGTALVIPYARLAPAVTLLYGSFAGAARNGGLNDFPTLAQWQGSAGAIGWTFVAGTALTSRPGWLNLGWPIPSKPGCPA